MELDLDHLEALERAAMGVSGTWVKNGLRDAMVCDGYPPQDAEYADAAWHAMPALLARLRALEAVALAAGDVQQWFNEATECPCCGNDGCSDVDEENEHAAGDRCAVLHAALGALAAAKGETT